MDNLKQEIIDLSCNIKSKQNRKVILNKRNIKSLKQAERSGYYKAENNFKLGSLKEKFDRKLEEYVIEEYYTRNENRADNFKG
ncbi:MAG: hypothetical protein K9K32_05850 [Halanaerobiales bacterium]|nr:hypothetical protein [Halanaerobiales bacterium]